MLLLNHLEEDRWSFVAWVIVAVFEPRLNVLYCATGFATVWFCTVIIICSMLHGCLSMTFNRGSSVLTFEFNKSKVIFVCS